MEAGARGALTAAAVLEWSLSSAVLAKRGYVVTRLACDPATGCTLICASCSRSCNADNESYSESFRAIWTVTLEFFFGLSFVPQKLAQVASPQCIARAR